MPFTNLILLPDSREFYRVIPNVCEVSYKKSALYQISPFSRDDIPKSILLVSYKISWLPRWTITDALITYYSALCFQSENSL